MERHGGKREIRNRKRRESSNEGGRQGGKWRKKGKIKER